MLDRRGHDLRGPTQLVLAPAFVVAQTFAPAHTLLRRGHEQPQADSSSWVQPSLLFVVLAAAASAAVMWWGAFASMTVRAGSRTACRGLILPPRSSSSAEIGDGTVVWGLAQVREGAVLGADCVIGRGAYVGAGVRLGDRVKVQNLAQVYEPAVSRTASSSAPRSC